MRFSANLGFLWTDRSLPDAIRAAKAAGFDAVECHWPFETQVSDVTAALRETDLPMLGLNTRRGDLAANENGLSALPDRVDEARRAIDEAVVYAAKIGAAKVHVMAGFAHGDEARTTYEANLRYACDIAAEHQIGVLIEPLNGYDAPGYFLRNIPQALEIIESVGAENLQLMFDIYHLQLTSGDVTNVLRSSLPWIGHIQFAAVPDRGPPDHGELNYAHIFETIAELGYSAPLGAEYKPQGDTDATLGWLKTYR